MYKQASRLDLQFNTAKGMVNVAQLWQLTQTEISNAIKAVNKVLKKTEESDLSFLEDTKVVDSINELRFEILKDVYITKKKEAEGLRTIAENKAHNQKILTELAERKDNAIKKLSDDELVAQLR